MSSEERIAVECLLRAHEDLNTKYEAALANVDSNKIYNQTGRFAYNNFEKEKGKIDGAKEVLRDLMRFADTKLS